MLSKTTLTSAFCNYFVVEKMPCKIVRLGFFGLVLHLVLHAYFQNYGTQYNAKNLKNGADPEPLDKNTTP